MLKNTVYLKHVLLRHKKGFQKHKKNFVEILRYFKGKILNQSYDKVIWGTSELHRDPILKVLLEW